MDKKAKLQIGQNIQKYRKEKGYRQKDLAIYLDCAETTIASWEQGLSSPDIETAYRLVKYLNLTLENLLEGIEI